MMNYKWGENMENLEKSGNSRMVREKSGKLKKSRGNNVTSM